MLKIKILIIIIETYFISPRYTYIYILMINLQNNVPIFLDTVTEINFLSCIMANTLLRTIVKIHMHKNGMEERPAFYSINEKK